MVKYSIKIFARLRPTKKATSYEINEEEDGTPYITYTLPRSEAGGLINNKKETYSFRFNGIFEQSVKQEKVFEDVAQPVIDNCLQGYNGTIFAYGQTGSGKTFTITGGAERYGDRGIIPRTLSYIFHYYDKMPGTKFVTQVSYLEIYNEFGYDLLRSEQDVSKLEDLPKVGLFEDTNGTIHLKNLSLHSVTKEEEALNWLFLGDTNRMIAETPMNMASTRSHCIFTVHISCNEVGSDIIRTSKLHLVDLAGSERVGKTGTQGTLLAEAKYINLSLHFLEQVIVALSEKSRSHIPYRNSMMTSVLRDSLGGNCMTSMIATLSVEKRNIEESVSTCRFAQRVALIKNEATLNEEVDPKLMVARLKQQVQDLKQEIVMVTGEERTDELTADEKDNVTSLVCEYVSDTSCDGRLVVGNDMRKIQLCYSILKQQILDLQQENKSSSVANNSTEAATSQAMYADHDNLVETLKQRDEEINVLLKMLKQERRRLAEIEAAMKERGIEWTHQRTSPILGRTSPISVGTTSIGSGTSPIGLGNSLLGRNSQEVASDCLRPSPSPRLHSDGATTTHSDRLTTHERVAQDDRAVLRTELSRTRQEAFDVFRRDIADTAVLEHHKNMLKAKYAEAKSLGEKVNASRLTINKLKSVIEKYRVATGLNGDADSCESDARDKMDAEKKRFKDMYSQLKMLKKEIEHIQHLLEKSKVQIQRDFEKWWTDQQQQRVSTDQSDHSMSDSSNTAYRTKHWRGSKRSDISDISGIKDYRTRDTVSRTSDMKTDTRSLNNDIIPLTGDARADADIIAFYKARQKLIKTPKVH